MFECSIRTFGNSNHPRLIFLHGFLGVKEDWEEMIPFFEKQYFCITLDLPGHGDSPYSDSILWTLKKWLETQKKPILIGYSMGGRIALQLQKQANAVIAISAHPGLSTIEERDARFKIDENWSQKLLKIPLKEFLKEWYAQPMFFSLGKIPAFPQRRLKQNPQNLAKVLLQMSLSAQPHITQFSCPTLFVYGEEDLKYQEIYCKSTNRKVNFCNHAAHLENPSHCAEQILNWLENIHKHT